MALIYLDNNATAPVLPEVLEGMRYRNRTRATESIWGICLSEGTAAHGHH